MSGPLSLVYRIGERTVPVVGGILAFWRLEAALDFIGGWGLQMFSGRGEEMPLPEFAAHWNSPPDVLSRVWTGELRPVERYVWPPGTVALAWFEPEEEIE
jgi:hypothetical protein